jgi:predicted CopG family antitoxin
MSVKSITIKEEVYMQISNMKREGESFSDVLERLAKRKADVMDFFGMLKDSEVLVTMEREILEERKVQVPRDVLL